MFGLERERASDQHLLLVAAAERGDLVGPVAHADRQLLALPFERAVERRPVDERELSAARLGAIERRQHVFEYAEIGEDALAFAVARRRRRPCGARRRRAN